MTPAGPTTIISGGALATPDGLMTADIAIADGRIAELCPELEGQAAESIDARGLAVLPGVIDAHVHLNEPGRTDWEGWKTGTRALAAGGATTVLDMPINSVPPVTTTAAFDAKRTAAEQSSLIDFGLWGGLAPDSLPRLEDLHAYGAVGFKAFMCNTGLDEFAAADDLTLYEGMSQAARLGALVAVHAENETITSRLAARAKAEGRRSVRDFLASRPVVSELEAIARAIAIAEETRCALHVVHVSCGKGVALVAEARARGVNVSCETCPHYLTLTHEDVERLGAVAKCAPPLRESAVREELWSELATGRLPMVASDHSPAPPHMKQGEDFFAIWGGISGCQSTLEILLGEGHVTRGLSVERVVDALAGFVARRFRLPGKAALDVGMDADLVLVALGDERALSANELFYRHRVSPYLGRRMHCRVVRTIVRGTTVYCDGRVVSEPRGRLVRPVADNVRMATNAA